MEPKLPTLYRKRDRNFYFTFRGRQYYAGSTPEKATRKLLEIVGTGNSEGPHSMKDAVKEYLASIEEVQSQDSVNTKRRTCDHVFGQEEEHGFLPGGGRGAALGLRRLRAALAEPGPGEDRRAAQAFAQFFTLSPWTS